MRFEIKNLIRAGYYRPFYGDEGEGGEGGEGAGGEGAGGEGAGGEGAGGEQQWDGKFTKEQQEAIDKQLNRRFAKEKEEKQKLISQLTSLKETAKLTEDERTSLSARIEDLENSLLTKEEQAAKAKAELEKRHAKELQVSKDEADLWKGRFTNAIIDRAITEAADEHGAESTRQLRLMFRGSTRLIENKDEATGKPNGTFTPHMKFIGLDDDKKEIDFELPVAEAIKKLKIDGLNDNLFKHGATGGTGKPPTGGQGTGTGSPDAMPTPDQYSSVEEYQKAYQAWRDTHNVDGTKRKQEQHFAGA